MVEAVRLVIWDLDETFWKGTLTEGGITEYLQAHHDIVVTLARRGIMSSICSKNDAGPILDILRDKGIADYFIFPSINWEPKGPRLAALIEAVALRPASVMFIDDNPGNRGEAAAAVPGLQIEDEHFIAGMLADPRFAGKDDEQLTRLAQYKLLEARHEDEQQATGDNAEFLRSCDIRVHIEYDVVPHIDRVIELINRTNQLNFTKKRLSEDMETARAALMVDIASYSYQCGLVHVADKYGDYGFVGFFMMHYSGFVDMGSSDLPSRLIHYCFSCRTMGMLVESWLYERLGRPRIHIVGDVLTDLFARRTIDWITPASSAGEMAAPIPRIAPEIRLHGGCDATSIGHYLAGATNRLTTTGNFHAGAGFVRLNGASLLLSACDRHGARFREASAAIAAPYELLTSSYFEDSPEGTLFIFGGQYDAFGPELFSHHRYRHKLHGWEIRVECSPLKNADFTSITNERIDHLLNPFRIKPTDRRNLMSMIDHVRQHYDIIAPPDDADLERAMIEIFERIPAGSKLIVTLDHVQTRHDNGVLAYLPWVEQYNALIRAIAAPYPFVGIVSYSDHIVSEDEIHNGGNHYDRMIYMRMAEAIMASAGAIAPKARPAVTTLWHQPDTSRPTPRIWLHHIPTDRMPLPNIDFSGLIQVSDQPWGAPAASAHSGAVP